MCVLIFSTMFVRNSSNSEKKWTRCDQNRYFGLHVRYPLFFSVFNETWIFWGVFEKYSKFIKIRPVGAELFHMGRHTDRHYEANNLFSLFCKASDNKLYAKFVFCRLDFDIIPSDGWALNVKRNILRPSSGFTPMATCCRNLEDCIVSLYLFVYLVSIAVTRYVDKLDGVR